MLRKRSEDEQECPRGPKSPSFAYSFWSPVVQEAAWSSQLLMSQEEAGEWPAPVGMSGRPPTSEYLAVHFHPQVCLHISSPLPLSLPHPLSCFPSMKNLLWLLGASVGRWHALTCPSKVLSCWNFSVALEECVLGQQSFKTYVCPLSSSFDSRAAFFIPPLFLKQCIFACLWIAFYKFLC